ncbi:hypothetical protein BC835DRAFT_374095 [Cytidiella melzeri]|nr:hypothetical protein BC835DRAFT_374095 [Cytidiella melzeri]
MRLVKGKCITIGPMTPLPSGSTPSAPSWLRGADKLTAELEREGLLTPLPKRFDTPLVLRSQSAGRTEQQRSPAAIDRSRVKGKGRASTPYPHAPSASAPEWLKGADRLNAELEQRGLLLPCESALGVGRATAGGPSVARRSKWPGRPSKDLAANGQVPVSRQRNASAGPSSRRDFAVVPNEPNSPVESPSYTATKRGRPAEEPESNPYKLSRARWSTPDQSQQSASLEQSDLRERETPPPPSEGPTEARAKFIMQELTKKVKQSASLRHELNDVVALIAITNKKNNQAQAELRALRRHRKVAERAYMMAMKRDQRLHDGMHSWTEPKVGEPERDHSYVGEMSEERGSSDFVASSDPSRDYSAEIYEAELASFYGQSSPVDEQPVASGSVLRSA